MAGQQGCEALNTKYGGLVKPDITFFGEKLPDRFYELAGIRVPGVSFEECDFDKCDLLIVMGTSLVVQPFASLIDKVLLPPAAAPPSFLPTAIRCLRQPSFAVCAPWLALPPGCTERVRASEMQEGAAGAGARGARPNGQCGAVPHASRWRWIARGCCSTATPWPSSTPSWPSWVRPPRPQCLAKQIGMRPRQFSLSKEVTRVRQGTTTASDSRTHQTTGASGTSWACVRQGCGKGVSRC